MKTLVLNVDFTPLSIISSKRAVVLSIANRIKVLEYYEADYRSEKESYKVPAVVLYEKFIKRPVREKPTKHQILIRDGMRCQYCNKNLSKATATVDHVVPISFFEKKEISNTWNNMVACCKGCNSYKRMRTPEQAKMTLISKPKKPHGFLIHQEIPLQWKNFVV